ncbi:CPBP family intramembrane metalloprotease [Aquimarina sp. ERC-38]|uniref:CPBP family intramembrane glutamic endopeptidase n=1 Tax=Aquimarina sp. ERC-38 TaxID=2949996 RepID=UPI002246323B|nr:CPBP family intramembrane glutamic endopeptidase [Aquimarina sp. ERC-38]UZO80203.1 CPBP family intramembrane metalloprotease [Aquimarina sp. ERC-38]
MFIAQAYKGDNTPWKVIVTILITSGIFILNLVAFLISDPGDMEQAYALLKKIPKNLSLILNLAPFALLLILLFLLVKYLHERSILSLTTSRSKVDFSRIFFGFAMVFIFTVVSFIIGYFIEPEAYELQFKPLNFIILVVISLVLFPFQIGLEEYLFRGFLMQQIGIALKNRWMPLIITSVLFGVFHSANPEVAELGPIVMIFYIGTGLLLGIMTLMDEGMELALGFHLGNNFLAATLVTAEYSALQTDAIFKSVGEPATLSELILPVFVVYPIFLFIMAKKYKWNHWKEKLTGKVIKPPHFTSTMNYKGIIPPKNIITED